MKAWRVAARITMVAALPVLQGCAAGLFAAQAVPMAVGGVAMANADDRNPFGPRRSPLPARSVEELELLDTHVRRARCGNAKSQYWVASALQNAFNATPDNAEIYKWYRLAEIGSFAPASAELTALGATMTAAELAEAQARVRDWQPVTADCPAGG